MNVIIIEPYEFNSKYDIRSLTPGLGPVFIASLLQEKGHQVQVISEYVSQLALKDLRNADLVGISIASYNAKRGFQLARQIKKPVVFGGFHASLMPEECLQYGEYVIRGDGYAIVDLVDFLEQGASEGIAEVPNLIYRSNGRFCYNRVRSGAINVIPNFKLVKDYYRFGANRLLRIPLLVNASRGCGCHCEFCAIRELNRDFIKRDVDIVIKDIQEQVKNRHWFSRLLPRVIWITDDNFFFDKKWAQKVLRRMGTLATDCKFTIQARLDIARDDDTLILMKKAGIDRVYLGIESLNAESLKQFKKEIDPEEIKFAVKKIKSVGIDIYGLFVFGDDAFHKGDGIRVAQFAKTHGFSGILIQPLTPYPGTSLFAQFKQNGRILHENWSDYNGKVVFKPRNLSPAELHEEICEAYKAFYSPLQVAKIALKSNKGFKLGGCGEAIFRHMEVRRTLNYIRHRY